MKREIGWRDVWSPLMCLSYCTYRCYLYCIRGNTGGRRLFQSLLEQAMSHTTLAGPSSARLGLFSSLKVGVMLLGMFTNIWNFNRNADIFLHENALESVVCEMVAILSRPQCVNVQCGHYGNMYISSLLQLDATNTARRSPYHVLYEGLLWK